jgi:pimeloyl-ACP methyl ester carboxylesterase
LSPSPAADGSGSAEVALDGPRVAELSLVRVAAGVPQGAPLAEVVPELVQLDPQRLEPLGVRGDPLAATGAGLASALRPIRAGIRRVTELDEELAWCGRRVRWGRHGSGPAVVLCHGTPWSSRLWAPVAELLAADYTTYLWDMPGYGESSKDGEHAVSLDVQGELLHDLLEHWRLEAPHVVAHDYGGAVALRAHLLHGSRFASVALVDVVALAPWGSDFFRLVAGHADVFAALPAAIHEGVVRAYVAGASHKGLTQDEADMLVGPWLGEAGQAAFYRQIAQADQAYTDEIEPLYPTLDLPVLVVWGRDDTWIPIDRGHRLAELIPGARLHVLEAAGHLVQLDQPVELGTILHGWLNSQEPGR